MEVGQVKSWMRGDGTLLSHTPRARITPSGKPDTENADGEEEGTERRKVVGAGGTRLQLQMVWGGSDPTQQQRIGTKKRLTRVRGNMVSAWVSRQRS